ncbi:hypothetical protein MTO96_000479 [Rhipicephalus appendiculatus]
MPADNSTPTKETNGKLERFEQEILHEIKREIQETHPEVVRCRQTGQYPPVAGDAQVIEVELAKHKVLMNDIQAHPGSVDTLNRAGHQLIEVHRHSEYPSVRQTEVADLNRRWKALQDKAAERQPKLEAALREAQALNREIQEFVMWLSDSGSQLASSKPIGEKETTYTNTSGSSGHWMCEVEDAGQEVEDSATASPTKEHFKKLLDSSTEKVPQLQKNDLATKQAKAQQKKGYG